MLPCKAGHVALLVLLLTAACGHAHPTTKAHGKLLYILLDGFRYDYVDDLRPQQLPGFTEFISNGVKARWVNPLYPSMSLPSWTTLVTGLYAESHNIVGNNFYDPVDKDFFMSFDNQTTGKQKWWTAEPLWTTATKAGLRVALYLWGRCDVPFDTVLPETCVPNSYIPGPEIFKTYIDKALDSLKEGYHLVQVYTVHVDNIGHAKGPETEDRRKATREVDATLAYLQRKLREMELEDEVNVVIVSDHGMSTTAPGSVTRLQLDQYLAPNAPVENIAGIGAYVIIKVLPGDGHVEEVYKQLSAMPGVRLFRKRDIPKDFHLAQAKYMHDLLLLADIDHFILASNRSTQVPPRRDFVYYGAHGFDAKEEKMRSIFYAKGPAFKSNTVLDPINIVDIYQVLTHTLGIDGRPNNGTWAHVADAFSHAPGLTTSSSLVPTVLPLLALVAGSWH